MEMSIFQEIRETIQQKTARTLNPHHVRAISQKEKPPLGGFLLLVEVVGIEPTSYSAAKKLSTYLVRLLFLFLQRG